jgi:hypothetical protein
MTTEQEEQNENLAIWSLERCIAIAQTDAQPETALKRSDFDEANGQHPTMGMLGNAGNINHGPSNDEGGVPGVYKTEAGTWKAQITVNGRTIHLGTFPTFMAAASARKMAQMRFWTQMRDEAMMECLRYLTSPSVSDAP